MIDTSTKLRYLSLFNAYPLVDNKAMPNLSMERAKMVLVANVISKTHNMREKKVLEKMCIIRGLNIDLMPTLFEATRITGVSLDFINDFGKIQFLYERNPAMQALPELIKTIKV